MIHRTSSVISLLVIVSLIAICSGCSISVSAPPASNILKTAPVLAAASAAQPVGEVIPVFIEVAGAGPFSAVAHREEICAIDDIGNCVPALDVAEAERLAGGADKLAAAVSGDESAAGAVGRTVASPTGAGAVAGLVFGSYLGPYGTLAGLLAGTAVGATTGVARGAYLAARVRKPAIATKLQTIRIQAQALHT